MKSAKENSKISIRIRPMRSSDLASILAEERKIFPDPWPKSAFEDHLEQADWGGLVALSDGKIAGYACWMVVADEGHLTNIAVSEAHRRKSVARHLLEAILVVTRDKSCEFILLEVRPSNEGAIAFYRKHGFDLLYRRPSYYHNPVEDALVMVKYFD
ncbi:MAG: ribosomal protein S18-alanine N-acetyltransferase [bacterium]|nr:ribosomal protein S18-alanine N-acetyltransferase [bacterium]